MSEEQRAGSVRAFLHRISPLLVIAVFAAAVFLLFKQVRQYSLAEIREAVLRVPKYQIVLSCILTAISYIVLMGYDLLAIKSVAHPLPLRRVALASFTGFATSYNFGALLGGGSVRFRLYSAWGLSPAEIVQLVVILGVTFWFGVFALAGVIFIVRPFEISLDVHSPLSTTYPLGFLFLAIAAFLAVAAIWKKPIRLGGKAFALLFGLFSLPGVILIVWPLDMSGEWHLPFATTFPLGFPLIAMAVAYLAVTVIWRTPIRLLGKDVKLPGFRMSAAQLAVAAGDLVIAAACFYVLLPKGVVSYLDFLGVYLFAIVVVVLSHVPGGVAVFELIILKMTPDAQRTDVVAAVLLFRVIYYLLPLLGAAALLVYFELRLRTRSFQQTLEKSKPNEAEIT